jgi:hypothetical protein
VKNIKVPRELPLGLTQPAVECVKRWTFEPAILNRKPAEVLQIQMVRFDLSAQAPGESILIEPEEDALNRSGDVHGASRFVRSIIGMKNTGFSAGARTQ